MLSKVLLYKDMFNMFKMLSMVQTVCWNLIPIFTSLHGDWKEIGCTLKTFESGRFMKAHPFISACLYSLNIRLQCV